MCINYKGKRISKETSDTETQFHTSIVMLEDNDQNSKVPKTASEKTSLGDIGSRKEKTLCEEWQGRGAAINVPHVWEALKHRLGSDSLGTVEKVLTLKVYGLIKTIPEPWPI